MVESIYFLKPAWCGTHLAGLRPEQGLQPVTRATALRRWFVTFLLHALGYVSVACPVYGQTFDVASVHLLTSPSGGITLQVTPISLLMRNVTLGYCLRWAYGIGPYNAYQLSL